jgi:hypothetical protein
MLNRVQNKLILFGFAFIVLGGVLLLWTLGYLPATSALWPVLLVLCGLWMLYTVFVRNARESRVFSGLFMALGGSVLLMMNTVLSRVALERIWPVFMAITGFSLFGYALKKDRISRLPLVIPAWAIIVLSLLFFPFSLGIVNVSFIRFVTLWWPVLFIVLGLALVLLHTRRHPT